MNVVTENDFIGVQADGLYTDQFTLLNYGDGSSSAIPKNFFCNWLDTEPAFGTFHIGRSCWIGTGSTVKYDNDQHCLRLGSYIAGGQRLRFILNGQHNAHFMSMFFFALADPTIPFSRVPQCDDTVVKNDVWLGDEAMILGGSTIENGCIIGARALLPMNFKSEPYGVYVGSPAKLIKFRFSEPVRERLLELAWWEMPLSWIKQNYAHFQFDLNQDEGRTLEALNELLRQKKTFQTAT